MIRAKSEFLILTILLIATRVCDVTSTYAATPDLKYETNPIVSIFEQGWTGVIFAQILLTLIVVILNYYSLFKVKHAHPSERGYSFRDFVAHYYFGEKKSPLKILYELPKSKTVLVSLLGYVLPRTLILIGAFISVSSTLLAASSSYRNFYHVARPYYYVFLVAAALSFCLLFFRREYALYKTRSITEPGGMA